MKSSSTLTSARTLKASIGQSTKQKKTSPAIKKPPARKAIIEFHNFCMSHGFQATLIALEKDLKRSGISIDFNSQPLGHTSPSTIKIDSASPPSPSDSSASSSHSESTSSTSQSTCPDRSSKTIQSSVNLLPSTSKPTIRPNSLGNSSTSKSSSTSKIASTKKSSSTSQSSSTKESPESDSQSESASNPSLDSEPPSKKVLSLPDTSSSCPDASSSSGSDSDPEPQPKSKPLMKIAKAPEKVNTSQKSLKKVAKPATIINPGSKSQVHPSSDSSSSDCGSKEPPATVPKVHPQKSIKKAQQAPSLPPKVLHLDPESSSDSDSTSESDSGSASEPVVIEKPSKTHTQSKDKPERKPVLSKTKPKPKSISKTDLDSSCDSRPVAHVEPSSRSSGLSSQTVRSTLQGPTLEHKARSDKPPKLPNTLTKKGSKLNPDKGDSSSAKLNSQQAVSKQVHVSDSRTKTKKTALEPLETERQTSFDDSVIELDPIDGVKSVETNSDDDSSVVELEVKKANVKSDSSVKDSHPGEFTSSPIKRKASFPGTPAELKRPKASEPSSLDNRSTKVFQSPSDVVNLNQKNKTKQTKTNEPFRRVRAEEVQLDRRLSDNSFLAKGGAHGSYGYKAHQDLSVTRGKAFQKEKNKKKRGSYRGGIIDTSSHSIKFD